MFDACQQGSSAAPIAARTHPLLPLCLGAHVRHELGPLPSKHLNNGAMCVCELHKLWVSPPSCCGEDVPEIPLVGRQLLLRREPKHLEARRSAHQLRCQQKNG